MARERVVETRTMRLRMGKLSAGGDGDDNDGDGDDNDDDGDGVGGDVGEGDLIDYVVDDEGGNDDMPSYGEMVLKISFKCKYVIG